MKIFTKVVALTLVFALILTATPTEFINAASVFLQAKAESELELQNSVAVSEPIISDSGWIYQVCADGYLEILGYNDASVKELSIPETIDSKWVTRIGENAFNEHAALESVFIPGIIVEIHDTAFPDSKNLSISAWTGSVGLEFAEMNGFAYVNKSKYDFFDHIIDLSELKSSQWGISGNSLRIAEPFDNRIEVGTELFIPSCDRFDKGMPIVITSVNAEDGYTLYGYETLDFSSSIESYYEENISLMPDLDNIVFLEEGFSLTPSTRAYSRSVNSMEVSIPVDINVSYKVNETTSLSGKLKWTPSIYATVDYSDFKVNEFSYTNTTTTVVAIGVKVDGSQKLMDSKDTRIDFAKVPLVSAGFVTAYAKLSIAVDVSGSVEMEVTMMSTESIRYRAGEDIKRDKNMTLGNVDFSARLEVGVKLEAAFAVCIGFATTDFTIDIAEIKVGYGFKFEIIGTLTSDYTNIGDGSNEDYGSTAVCVDINPKIVFECNFKIGAYLNFPGAGSVSKGISISLFKVEEPIGRLWHIESDNGLVDECTRGVLRVRFYSGSGSTPPDQLVDKGKKVTRPENPVREGYTFDGWYKEKELENEWNFYSDVVTESTILYAGWINVVGELEYLEDNDVLETEDYIEWVRLTSKLNDETEDPNDTVDIDPVYAVGGWNGNPKKLDIPSEYDGLSVTSLGYLRGEGILGVILSWYPVPPFKNCTSLESINVPNSVTKIYEECFYGCKNLSTIKLSSNISSIEKSTFRNCASLKTITIPEGVTSIGDYAFYGCTSLEYITLPSTLKSIGANAFYGCTSLGGINLPAGLENIGNNAFENCTSLTGIRLPANLNSLGSSAFRGCTALETARITASPGDYSFRDCTSLREVTLTSNVSSIGKYAFYNCDSLQNVEIPKSAVTIGDYAFYDCDKLVYVSLWANPGKYAFENCDLLEEVCLHEGITAIGYEAFRDCRNLWKIELPSSLETIDAYAFYRCSLYSVDIPQNVKSIGNYAFAYNGYDSYTGTYDFNQLTIGENVETINANVIYGTNTEYLLILTVPGCAADTAFASSSFSGCIEYIADDYYFLNLVLNDGYMTWGYTKYNEAGEILDLWERPVRTDYVFTGWYRDEACTKSWDVENDIMPYSDLTLYAGWKPLPEGLIYELRNGYDSSGKGVAFITGYTGKNTELDIPEEVNGFTVYGIDAYAIPAGVNKVNLPDSIRILSDKAFVNAADLLEITVDGGQFVHSTDGVLYMNNVLFAYPRAKAMETFSPEDGTTSISGYAFYGTSALQEVVLPVGVDYIGTGAFARAEALKSVTLPEGVTWLDSYVFYECPLLEKLELPASLSEIRENAIASCRSLTEVDFKRDASIAANNFKFCGGDEDLYIYGPVNASKLTAYADANGLNYNEYAVRYVLNNEVVAIVTERAGTKLAVPPSPSSDERIFAGWSLEKNGEAWDYEKDLMPQESITLYALMKYDFIWEEVDGGVKLLKYIGNEQEIRVPETVDGMNVISIAYDCFSDVSVKKLIGNFDSVSYWFAWDYGYAYETIEYTIIYDANGGCCNLSRSEIYEMTSDGQSWSITGRWRDNYSFTNWYLDEACTQIWDEEFPYANITVYAGWSKIDESIEDISFEYRTHNGKVYITGYIGNKTTVEIPSVINGYSVVAIDDYAFFGNQVMFNVTIPSSVKSIGNSAFSGSRVNTITFANGLETIGVRAFADCRELSTLSLPTSVQEVGQYAFANCSSLTGAIDLRMPVVPIGMFSGCSYLEEITVYHGVEKICDRAFANCGELEYFFIYDDDLSEVEASAFDGCSRLKRFLLVSSMYFKVIDGALFTKDGTTLIRVSEGYEGDKFTLPKGVLYIGEGAMKNTKIKTLVLNEELILIEKDALRNSYALKQVVFAENGRLESIGENAFSNCRKLEKLDLPETLVSLEPKAFSNCNLKEVYIAKDTYLAENSISANDGLTIFGFSNSFAAYYAEEMGIRFVDLENDIPVESIKIPYGITMEIGKSLTLWSQFEPADTTEKSIIWKSKDPSVVTVNSSGEIFALRGGETEVTATAQNGYEATCWIYVTDDSGLPTEIEVGASMIILNVGETKAINVLAIAENQDYRYVEEEIEDWTIAEFDNYSYEGEPSMVTGLKVGRTQITFTTCNGLMETCEIVVVGEFTNSPDIILPAALKVIEEEAFANSRFSSVRCPEGMNEISKNAFRGAECLTQIYIPDTVRVIGENAFSGCSKLIIYGTPNSEAESYAKQNGIPFVGVD